MLEQRSDHVPDDIDFVDWGLARLDYDVLGQTLEVDLSGPAVTDWRLVAQFGRVVYFQVYGEWMPYLWKEYGDDDAVSYFGEQSTLAHLTAHLGTSPLGLTLTFPAGSTIWEAKKTIAEPNIKLRAFLLSTRNVSIQWLCRDVEVQYYIQPDTGPAGEPDAGMELRSDA